MRKYCGKLCFGDGTRLELLHAANVGGARLFVLAIDESKESVACAQLLRHLCPALPIIARARNRTHLHRLLDVGVTCDYSETSHTSLEMAQQSLLQLGIPLPEAAIAISKFRNHDLAPLKRQQAVYLDETKLMQTAREASEALATLFEADREEGQPEP